MYRISSLLPIELNPQQLPLSSAVQDKNLNSRKPFQFKDNHLFIHKHIYSGKILEGALNEGKEEQLATAALALLGLPPN